MLRAQGLLQREIAERSFEERVGAKVLLHIADALGKLGDTIARHIPEIDRFDDAVGEHRPRR